MRLEIPALPPNLYLGAHGDDPYDQLQDQATLFVRPARLPAAAAAVVSTYKPPVHRRVRRTRTQTLVRRSESAEARPPEESRCARDCTEDPCGGLVGKEARLLVWMCGYACGDDPECCFRDPVRADVYVRCAFGDWDRGLAETYGLIRSFLKRLRP